MNRWLRRKSTEVIIDWLSSKLLLLINKLFIQFIVPMIMAIDKESCELLELKFEAFFISLSLSFTQHEVEKFSTQSIFNPSTTTRFCGIDKISLSLSQEIFIFDWILPFPWIRINILFIWFSKDKRKDRMGHKSFNYIPSGN